MKANELRIGNYIRCNEPQAADYFELTGSHFKSMLADIDEYIKWVEPIPLTEEWLLKFGFDKAGCKHVGIDTSFKIIQCCNDSSILAYDQEDDFIVLSNSIKYVHQLQNLYFALTGEELTLNETL